MSTARLHPCVKVIALVTILVAIGSVYAIEATVNTAWLPVAVFGIIAFQHLVGYVGMRTLGEVPNPLMSAVVSFIGQAPLSLGVLALGTNTVDIRLASVLLIAAAVFAFSVYVYDLGQLITGPPKEGMQLSVWDHIIDSIIAVAVYSTIAWAGFWEPLYAAGQPPILIGAFVVFVVNLALVLIQRLISLSRVSKSLIDGLFVQVMIIGVLTTMANQPQVMAKPVLQGLMVSAAIIAFSCWLPGGSKMLKVDELPHGLQVGRVVTVTLAAGYVPLALGILGPDDINRLTLISVMVTLLLFFRMQAVITIRDREMQQVNKLAEELEFQAKHDLTTGLYNLQGLEEIITQRVAIEGRDVALVMIALDGFDHVNDIHGYTAGDEALQVIAKRLSSELRPNDTAACYSGDEFIVLLDQVDRPELGAHLAARLIDTIQEPCRLAGGEEVRLGACAGVALSTMTVHSDLIIDAELAVNQVRGAGRGTIRLADGSGSQRTFDQISREDMQAMLEGDALECQFTPIHDLQTNEPVAMAMHADWTLPGSPHDLASFHQLNGPWFTWLFGRAMAFATQANAPVHLTICGGQLGSLELLPALDRMIAKYDVPQGLITIGIDCRKRLNHVPIEDFHARGVMVSLDHFGASGVNLADLPHLPLDLLSIDPVLVRDMVADRGYRVVVETIIRSATQMDVPVTCRGIETERIAAVATSLGASYGQGHHWGPPMTAQEALEYWTDHAQPARRS